MLDRQHPADDSARAGSPREDRWVPLILPSSGNSLRRRLDLSFRRAHLSPGIIEVDSYQLMTDLIHQSRGYTIAPSCYVAGRREGQYWWSPINNLSLTWAIAVQEE